MQNTLSDATPPRQELALIYAHGKNRELGLAGSIPWHLPEDLAHFKTATLGAPVLMGRKTWDSLPAAFRPLPGRFNIVLSRDAAWQGQGAHRAESLPHALTLAASMATQADTVWVIGGADIYALALPLATRVLATEIDAHFAADAYAPVLDVQAWIATDQSDWRSAQNGLRYRFVTWQRRPTEINGVKK